MNRRSFFRFLVSAPLAIPAAIASLPLAKQGHALMKADAVNGLSLGYRGDVLRSLVDGMHASIAEHCNRYPSKCEIETRNICMRAFRDLDQL